MSTVRDDMTTLPIPDASCALQRKGISYDISDELLAQKNQTSTYAQRTYCYDEVFVRSICSDMKGENRKHRCYDVERNLREVSSRLFIDHSSDRQCQTIGNAIGESEHPTPTFWESNFRGQLAYEDLRSCREGDGRPRSWAVAHSQDRSCGRGGVASCQLIEMLHLSRTFSARAAQCLNGCVAPVLPPRHVMTFDFPAPKCSAYLSIGRRRRIRRCRDG